MRNLWKKILSTLSKIEVLYQKEQTTNECSTCGSQAKLDTSAGTEKSPTCFSKVNDFMSTIHLQHQRPQIFMEGFTVPTAMKLTVTIPENIIVIIINAKLYQTQTFDHKLTHIVVILGSANI